MKESLQNIIDLIINPRAAFTLLMSEPKWVTAFTLYCLFSFLLAWTLMPYTQKLLAVRTVDAGDSTKTVSILSITVFSTAYTVLMAILLSALLTIVARVARIASPIRLKHVYAVFCHLMLIRIATFLVNAGLLPEVPTFIQTTISQS